MEFGYLRFFLALGETRHCGRAAQHLGTTQPILPRQIRALAEESGAPLFSRDRRHVETTDAGRAIEPLAAASGDWSGRSIVRWAEASAGTRSWWRTHLRH